MGVQGSDLDVCLLEDLLHLVVVRLIEVHLCIMLLFLGVQFCPRTALDGLLGNRFASGEVHQLHDVLLHHQRVDLPFEIVIANVG